MMCPGAETRNVIDGKIHEEISDEFDDEELNRIVRYSFEKGGKRCRGIFLLLTCEALSGRRQEALDAAVAIELFHTASLVFDDMVDEETSRRKSQPLHVSFGRQAAITCGLFLASKAVEMLSRYDDEDVVRVAAEAIVKASQGEMLDVLSKQAEGLERYLEIATLKTGALFAASAGIGALLAKAARKHVSIMSECGRLIGVSFQLRDDYLDLAKDQARKSVCKDMTSDVVSRLSKEHAERAKADLAREFGTRSTRLMEFADYVCTRLE